MNKMKTGAPSMAVPYQIGRMSQATPMADPFSSQAAAALTSHVWQAAVERRGAPVDVYRSVFKRTLDILFILFTLPFSFPIIAFCAIALWLEGGNPFYTQDRLGRGGRRFSILKLRTMVADADAQLEKHLKANPSARLEWNRYQKLKNDPRVTPIGRALRAASIDELPQLINVLIGDMSIVGPRPMLPEQLPMYGDPTQYNALRPGITGLWQVSARNAEQFSYRNEVDGVYETTLTAQLDIQILFKTVGVVLRRTGH